MRRSARITALTRGIAGAVAILVVSALGSDAAARVRSELPEPDATWFEGAEGFAQGFERAEADGQAVLLYFYTDWCGYCRQLESKLLEQSSVMDYTEHLVKIRVNPEKGSTERALAKRYGVRGFPAVFVHPGVSNGPKAVARMVVDRGKRRLMTPAEYVDSLARATGERFDPS